MTVRAFLMSVLIIHAFMWVAIVAKVYDCPARTIFSKLGLIVIALVIPVLGPVYVNYRLRYVLSSRGRFIDPELPPEHYSDLPGNWSEGSSNDVSSSVSPDSGGGGE